eukprot:Amastigsp_a174936_128.p5 type:complete len:102 gc:universal Amastigsp_a174936_128:1081-1386(+)
MQASGSRATLSSCGSRGFISTHRRKRCNQQSATRSYAKGLLKTTTTSTCACSASVRLQPVLRSRAIFKSKFDCSTATVTRSEESCKRSRCEHSLDCARLQV